MDTGTSEKFSTFTNWATVIIALGAIIGLVMVYMLEPSPRVYVDDLARIARSTSLETQVAATAKSLDEIKQNFMQAETRLKELMEIITEKGSAPGRADIRPLQVMVKDVATEITEVRKQSKQIDERMIKIEGVILADPLKAIELPLIKRDLQSLQSQLERDLRAVRDENLRAYDMMKWLFGLMGIVSLSLIGLAVGNIFKGRTA